MNIKIRRFLALMMLVALIILPNGCDRVGLKRSGSQNKQNVNNPVSKESKSVPQEKAVESAAVSETLPDLPANKYGRDNPFSPLVRSYRGGGKPAVAPVANEEKPKVIEYFIVRLSAIFGDKAMFAVDGNSKSLSVGGEVAGMTVAAISGDQVVLKKEKAQPITVKIGDQVKIPKP